MVAGTVPSMSCSTAVKQKLVSSGVVRTARCRITSPLLTKVLLSQGVTIDRGTTRLTPRLPRDFATVNEVVHGVGDFENLEDGFCRGYGDPSRLAAKVGDHES